MKGKHVKKKPANKKVGKKRMSFISRFFISMGATFAAIILFFGGLIIFDGLPWFISLVAGDIFEGMEQDEAIKSEELGIDKEEDYFSDDIVNIALFGVDTLDKKMVGRSDSIIIVTLDHKKNEIRMSAIQRDSYVEIDHPKRGKIKDKINHAYAYGGPKLAVKTLNQNFELDIKDYVVINFTNMEKVVDTLGGIELEVSSAYRSEANLHIRALANARKISPKLIQNTGKQELNGMQVLGMLRCRKQVGGVGVRSEMHEILLNACFEKIKTKSVTEYPGIAKELLKLVKTTLSSEDVIDLAIDALTGGYEMRQGVFPVKEDFKGGYGGKMIKGVYYLTFNEKTMPENLRKFVYEGILPEEKK